MLNTIIDRIETLCISRNITVNKMLAECGLGKDLIKNIRSGSCPTVAKLIPVAKYFNVSLDYLCGIDTEQDEERKLLINYFMKQPTEELKKLYSVYKIFER